jgi:5-methylcytosine-specific restriction endonuclease McrA
MDWRSTVPESYTQSPLFADEPEHDPSWWKRKQFCRNGHDTLIVGRRADGWCRECARQKKRAWAEANDDKVTAQRAAYYAENADALRARSSVYGKARRAETPGYNTASNRRWQHANVEKMRAYRKAWRTRNPEKVSAYCRRAKYRRRARIKASEHVRYDYDAIVYGATHCGICGEAYAVDDLRSLDHIIPVSRGGADAPWNVQSAHLRCNQIKGDRDVWQRQQKKSQPRESSQGE